MTGTLSAAFERLSPRRVHGIAAVLLPYLPTGGIDWEGFERGIVRTRDAGLDCAVNMDTGFGDLLTPAERRTVLDHTRRALGSGPTFYAGAFADAGGSPELGYERSVAEIDGLGAIPVIVQCLAMHDMSAAEKVGVYRRAAGAASAGALAFELSPRFAAHGEIWDEETFSRLLEVTALRGAKHSSLDRTLELSRLAARDRARPDFRVYTGNDLAIDMVAFGSDYLLGLAGFAPDRFARRDRLLEEGDAGFLTLNDALQHLGATGFRSPIPAYKHSAAQFLHLCDRLGQDDIHPRAPRRPGSERILLLDCAVRLGLVSDPEKVWQERVRPHLAEAGG